MRYRLAVLLARLAQGRSPRVWSLLCDLSNRLATVKAEHADG